MIRPKRDRYFMDVANMVATRSTCPRLAVGAVLVDSMDRIVGTGYNGSPRKVDHCFDQGCMLRDDHCVRSVHAEVNAILNATQHGSISRMYCTHMPCLSCVNICLNAGIQHFIFASSYKADDAVMSMALHGYITLVQVPA